MMSRSSFLFGVSLLALTAADRADAMPAYVGGTQIAKLYKGSTEIARAYKGSTLVFSNETGEVFEGGDVDEGSILEAARLMATGADSAGPQAGGTLTINSESLGSYDYVIKAGNQTISSFTNSDWFTTTADSRSAFVIVKGNLTINSGQVLRPSNRKLFTVVYVTGDLAIAGGISMSARGANHGSSGSNITAAAIRIATGTFGGVENPQVPAAGASGGAGFTGPEATQAAGNPGGAGTNGQTGGGGTGAASDLFADGWRATIGAGAAGTSFSGGAASGGAADSGTGHRTSTAASPSGGPGSGGAAAAPNSAGGGAGNPGGVAGGSGVAGSAGTGGVLIIICEGELSGAGSITAAGVNGGAAASGSVRAGGGGSGGGSVTVLYGSDTSSITPTALGGVGGSGGSGGGAGGNGTARKLALAA